MQAPIDRPPNAARNLGVLQHGLAAIARGRGESVLTRNGRPHRVDAVEKVCGDPSVRNNRIGPMGSLNRCCTFSTVLESMLLTEDPKIPFQQYRSNSVLPARSATPWVFRRKRKSSPSLAMSQKCREQTCGQASRSTIRYFVCLRIQLDIVSSASGDMVCSIWPYSVGVPDFAGWNR
jgi:hypothetical protein